MKLTDLNPGWINSGGPGIFNADMTPATPRKGIGIIFDCPCGKCDEYHRLFLAFTNPLDGSVAVRDKGEPTWERSGTTFEMLTISPSINRVGGCGWHGWIRNGQVISC